MSARYRAMPNPAARASRLCVRPHASLSLPEKWINRRDSGVRLVRRGRVDRRAKLLCERSELKTVQD